MTATTDDERTPLLSNGLPVTPDGLDSPVSPISQKAVFKETSFGDLVWILVGLWTAVFLGALDGTIVATLLSPIGSYFNKSNQASYLGTSYLLSVAACTPLYGRLSDIIGRKGAMLLGVGLFTLGTLLCGLAPSMEFLIFARAVAGTGGGGYLSFSSITVTDLVPLRKRGQYQGVANICFGLGAGLGGPLGGWLNDAMGWRFAFLIQIPFLLLSSAVIAWKVNVPLPPAVQSLPLRDKLNRIDYLGSFTLVLTISAVLLPISLKATEDIPWSHPLVWGLLAGSIIPGSAFVWVESNWSPYPILPLRLIKERTVLAVALTNFFVSAQAFSVLYNVPMYFAAVRQASASESGLHLLPNSVALAVGSLFAGWEMRRSGKYWWLIFGSSLMSLLATILLVFWNDGTSWFELWFDIVPSGFGASSAITATLIAIIASASRDDVAVATGITYTFRTVGQVLGVSLSGATVQGVLVRQLRERITGPGSEKIIEQVRHSTSSISDLEPTLRKAALDSYAVAMRVVFIGQVVTAVFLVLSTLPIQEFPLPGSHEEQAEIERRRQERLSNRI
ncbi:vacuolar amino acid permease [Sistotremastrum niveocremeum HHB9708]|uniref:Vacuolar amino acid permease n=1 Tax=Sistotremastrum niveocremeum HHB9708 TaxID=1314777 RepID=A0A164Z3W2_9AGAM|nr:vacuolar amino acid permease [Sistotremastrum niveocremeum HHB9708]